MSLNVDGSSSRKLFLNRFRRTPGHFAAKELSTRFKGSGKGSGVRGRVAVFYVETTVNEETISLYRVYSDTCIIIKRVFIPMVGIQWTLD